MTRNTGQPSILAIDDEPQLLAALGTILEGRGYRLRTARNGAMALDAVADERPDVVLLDLAMPGIDGLEVCRRLRAFSRVPILASLRYRTRHARSRRSTRALTTM